LATQCREAPLRQTKIGYNGTGRSGAYTRVDTAAAIGYSACLDCWESRASTLNPLTLISARDKTSATKTNFWLSENLIMFHRYSENKILAAPDIAECHRRIGYDNEDRRAWQWEKFAFSESDRRLIRIILSIVFCFLANAFPIFGGVLWIGVLLKLFRDWRRRKDRSRNLWNVILPHVLSEEFQFVIFVMQMVQDFLLYWEVRSKS
jgi:hypothetical protein